MVLKMKVPAKSSKKRERSAVTYSQNAEHIKQRSRERSAMTYSQNPEPIKEKAREHSAVIYSQNPEPQRKRAIESFLLNPTRMTHNRKN